MLTPVDSSVRVLSARSRGYKYGIDEEGASVPPTGFRIEVPPPDIKWSGGTSRALVLELHVMKLTVATAWSSSYEVSHPREFESVKKMKAHVMYYTVQHLQFTVLQFMQIQDQFSWKAFVILKMSMIIRKEKNCSKRWQAQMITLNVCSHDN